MSRTPIYDSEHLQEGSDQPEVPVNEMVDVIERALNDTVEWTIAGDVQPTKAQMAEGFFHKLTGSPSSAFAFGIPATGRHFVVINESGKTCTVYVQGQSGGGVNVADGVTVTLRSDGVNVEEVGGGGNQSQIYPEFTSPVNGDFDWVNQGSASVTVNANGGIHLIAPANASTSYRIRKKAAPATPYTITAAFIFNFATVDFQQGGLLWRQSSDGKLVTMAVGFGNTFPGDVEFVSQDYTNETSFSASNATQDAIPVGVVWLRIADDGVTRTASYSFDGYNFVTLLSEGRTTFLTADEVGFFMNTSSAAVQAAGTLLSWEEN